MRSVLLAMAAATVLLAGCTSGPPPPQEMARVYLGTGPQAATLVGWSSDPLILGNQLADESTMMGAFRPLFSAAKQCGLSRRQCQMGIRQMSDQTYAGAVMREMARLMVTAGNRDRR